MQPHEQHGGRPKRPPEDWTLKILVGVIVGLVGVIVIEVAKRYG